jgi:hypothetical protein
MPFKNKLRYRITEIIYALSLTKVHSLQYQRKWLPYAEPLGDEEQPSFIVIYNVPLILLTRLRYENTREFFCTSLVNIHTMIKRFFVISNFFLPKIFPYFYRDCHKEQLS